jgi:hypothetical protein
VFLLISFTSLRHKTLTYDEKWHYLYGARILRLDSDRFDDSKMPFSAFNALPRKFAPLFQSGEIQNYLEKIQVGRFATVIFSALLGYLVFYWSKTLYGFIPGLFSLFLYIFDPNIIAHSQLVTTDIYAALMILLAMFTFWRFSNNPTWKTGFIAALTLGIAQLAKYTCAYLYPIFLIVILVRQIPRLREFNRDSWRTELRSSLASFIKYCALFVAVSLVVINIGFLFNDTGTPLGEYEFDSDLFNGIQSTFEPFANIPVPVPYPYLQGLDAVSYKERTGAYYGRTYLMGELHQAEGFPGYYFIASIFKVPIAIQVLIVGSIAYYFVHYKKYKFLENEVYFLAPILFFILYFNFLFRAQIGFRFILVIFPLLYTFMGKLAQNFLNFHKRSKFALLLLLGYLVGSVLSYHPHYLTYFSEFVGERKFAYKYLADSNLDWGQSEFYLEQYLDEHPDAVYQPLYPTSGTIVVSPNHLTGILRNPEHYAWLRDNFEPAGTIANTYLIYEIDPEDLQ